MIYHIGITKTQLSEDQKPDLKDLKLIHESFISIKGLAESIYGKVENLDNKGTMIGIKLIDSEGVKAGHVYIKGPLYPEDIVNKPFVIPKPILKTDIFPLIEQQNIAKEKNNIDKSYTNSSNSLKDNETNLIEHKENIDNHMDDQSLPLTAKELIKKSVRKVLVETMTNELNNYIYPFFKSQREVLFFIV